MTTLHSLFFFCIRHIYPFDPDNPPFSSQRSILRLLPVPGQTASSALLDLGGRQLSLILSLTSTEAFLDLSCLDNLLEATFTSARIRVAGPDTVIDAAVNSENGNGTGRKSDSILIPGLSLKDGMNAGDSSIRVLKYGVRADFLLPDVDMPMEVPSSPLTQENDVVFLFPRAGARDNKLWASSIVLSQSSPYFARLFASPPCISCDVVEHPGPPGGTWAKPLMEVLRNYQSRADTPGPLLSHDSDDESLTSSLDPGYARRPRNMVNLPFSRAAPIDKPLRYIIVKSTSYRTFRAVLHYLTSYTISFSCLLSAREISARGSMENGHLAASPKSVYKLARQLGIKKLEELAEKDLISQVRRENWVGEFCSDAATEWDGVREALIQALGKQAV